MVDDDYGVISPVFVPLARDGYRILAAQSVSDALDIIYSDQEITLAICDLILPYGTEVVGHPHYSGVEVIEALRRVRPDVKVLCFSVVSRSEVLARLKSLGVYDTIQKPVRPTELRSRVLAAMESPSEPEQRELVEEEIGRCLAALGEKDIKTRIRAAWALGELGQDNAKVLSSLEKALSVESDTNVRRAIVDAIGKIRSLS